MARPKRRNTGGLGEQPIERLFSLARRRPPVVEEEFLRRLGRQSAGRNDLRRWYKMLRREGWISVDAEGKVELATREGKIRINPRGFGFVVTPGMPGEDVFVPERWLAGARHDDTVLIWVRPGSDGRFEGRVMKVVERSTEHVIGRLDRGHFGWRVFPIDPRLPEVRVPHPAQAKAGDAVVARIKTWPRGGPGDAEGAVESVLGAAQDPGMDITMLAASRGLPHAFPPEVEAAAQALPDRVLAQDFKGRIDLRKRFIVTIDGSDAKDLDDAISVEPIDRGWRVGVHIADVSHYVADQSPLDREALERGTSVYLVDRVIPMLPVQLSNQIASLNPGVERLTFTAWVDLDKTGKILSSRLQKSVIQTRHRLTYEEVNDVLAGGADPKGIGPWLAEAVRVRDRLFQKRVGRGAIDFDLPEAKVVLDDAGKPVEIRLRPRGPAESLIEELMLLANQVVAHILLKERLPGLYRVHDQPDAEKLEQFRELIGAFGYRLPAEITPKALQELLEKVKGKDEERVVNAVLLRSMRQARYSPENIGHFGLAATEYSHFTSPIRRYPDLFIHRVLTERLAGRPSDELRARWEAKAAEVADIASAREREAMEAERESVLMKEIEFMRDKLGERYDGIVSGVTGFGVFVELPNLVEGLIRIEDLPQDHWQFDPVHYRLSGERTGRRVRLGDRVTVEVARVDTALKRIDLAWVEPVAATQPKKPRKSSSRRRPRRKVGKTDSGSETSGENPRTG